MKPVVVGLTGGIGVGKSSVAETLRTLGADIVSGDELGREVIERDAKVKDAIVSELGASVLNQDHSLNRRRIAELVFVSPDRSRWLTHLTFPAIHRLWRERCEHTLAQVIVFDAALIFEWGIEREFDIVLVVTAPEESILARAQGRFSVADLAARASAQMPVEGKITGATHVIVNEGTLAELESHVRKFWTEYIQTRLT